MKRSNIDNCRVLRKNQTEAERKLWSMLRNRGLAGVKFRRQVAVEKYILDFYSPEYRLAIEADGGQHYDECGRQSDELRTQELKKHGIHVLRFSNVDVLTNINGVSDVIEREISQRGKAPSPRSSPRRGEDETAD